MPFLNELLYTLVHYTFSYPFTENLLAIRMIIKTRVNARGLLYGSSTSTSCLLFLIESKQQSCSLVCRVPSHDHFRLRRKENASKQSINATAIDINALHVEKKGK